MLERMLARENACSLITLNIVFLFLLTLWFARILGKKIIDFSFFYFLGFFLQFLEILFLIQIQHQILNKT
jgi:hypothetical protein